jgi:YesN/AraC family two-component response regulator
MGTAGSLLIIDDDPGIQEALVAALSPTYQVHTAASASAALEALCAYPFDLILLDYRLPDLPGTSVLQVIKRFFPDTMVILMTGVGTEEVVIEALRGGARDYLRKPIDLRDLQARIARLLALRRVGTERRKHPPVQNPDPAVPWTVQTLPPESADRTRSVLRGLRYMDAHLDSTLRLEAVARAAGMSKYHFCRRFRACTGLSFREYLTRQRITRAKELLKTTGRSITDIFPDVGFKDMTHFGRVFKKLEGQLPSEFRRHGCGDPPRDPAHSSKNGRLNGQP